MNQKMVAKRKDTHTHTHTRTAVVLRWRFATTQNDDTPVPQQRATASLYIENLYCICCRAGYGRRGLCGNIYDCVGARADGKYYLITFCGIPKLFLPGSPVVSTRTSERTRAADCALAYKESGCALDILTSNILLYSIRSPPIADRECVIHTDSHNADNAAVSLYIIQCPEDKRLRNCAKYVLALPTTPHPPPSGLALYSLARTSTEFVSF